ncbi:phosphomethylpyrimidine synthase [Bacteroidia bacterium]|nr:phosphomethylpyrimidine synthase [Bacteroidia bacterium]
MNFNLTKEVSKGYISNETLESMFSGNCIDIAYISHPTHPVVLGDKFLLKVNTNIGISKASDLAEELRKIETISKLSYAPDYFMDHTRELHLDKPVWKYLSEITNKPTGTVPVYSVADSKGNISRTALLERIEEMGANGVNFITIHACAMKKLYELAKKSRRIPCSSWGGGLVLKDVEINRRETNIVDECFDDILKLATKYSLTINIGSTFRPATIEDALDEVSVAETKLQKKYIDKCKKNGVQVVMEGVGHMPLSKIPEYGKLVAENGTPLMPLGPIPTDSVIDFDHVAAAIGATFMAKFGNTCAINTVSRAEHTGGIPTTEIIVEALKAARTVEHIINLERFVGESEIDKEISDKRANFETCVVDGGLFEYKAPDGNSKKACSRCSCHCPLVQKTADNNFE